MRLLYLLLLAFVTVVNAGSAGNYVPYKEKKPICTEENKGTDCITEEENNELNKKRYIAGILLGVIAVFLIILICIFRRRHVNRRKISEV